MLLRRGLHALGFRYRLHQKTLPGRPDLVFPSRKAVLLVHGCFWHGHDCHLFHWPSTRPDFWRAKISGNVRRDAVIRQRLAATGWRIGEVWECALRGGERLALPDSLQLCTRFLRGDQAMFELASASARGTIDPNS